jgi:adenylate kinase family enzyme
MQHQRRIVAEPPRRVLVLGSPGAGKTRLAALIAERFGLPVVSLEREGGGFDPLKDKDGWPAHVAELAAGEHWVMTSNSPETFDASVPRADWLIFLNVPMSVCLVRVIREGLRQRRAKAGDARAARSRWSDLRGVWSFPTEVLPQIMRLIERERRSRTIHILHSAKDVSQFLARLNGVDRPDQKLPSGRRSL